MIQRIKFHGHTIKLCTSATGEIYLRDKGRRYKVGTHHDRIIQISSANGWDAEQYTLNNTHVIEFTLVQLMSIEEIRSMDEGW